MSETCKSVLLLLPKKDGGGMQAAFEELLRYFGTHREYAPSVLFRRGGKNGEPLSAAPETDFTMLSLLPLLIRSILARKPDILYVGSLSLALLVFWAPAFGIRVVARCHCTLRYAPMSILARLRRQATVTIISQYAFVIAPCRDLRDELRAIPFTRHSRILFVPYCIKHVPSGESGSGTMGTISEKVVELFWVGRFAHQKDPLLALRIFKKVQVMSELDTKFTMIGDGPMRSDIEACIAERGLSDSVELVGWQKEPFKGMDGIYLFTSVFEGFGLVNIEALSHGIPTFVSQSPHGPREIALANRRGSSSGRLPVETEGAAEKILALHSYWSARSKDRHLIRSDALEFIDRLHRRVDRFYSNFLAS